MWPVDLAATGADAVNAAYFSMEIGLHSDMPTYSGGLGVLAGDVLRAAADLAVPVAGVTLLYHKGHFRQRLDATGNQTEVPDEWNPAEWMERLSPRVVIQLDGRDVYVGVWRFVIRGVGGHVVPVYLLDTNQPENSDWHRTLTDLLYGGDGRYRLAQEAVLGLGGVAMLRALGYDAVTPYHMNEGHSALLTLALAEQIIGDAGPEAVTATVRDLIRQRCVFTTHTPVAAGHDKFPTEMVRDLLGERRARILRALLGDLNGTLNMTLLALACSRYVNGVSKRHEEVSRDMFPGHDIAAVTNGVHAGTWTSPAFMALYDRHIPEWRRDNLYLRYAWRLPRVDIAIAHHEAKRALVAEVERRTGERLDPTAFTIGFARRATAYKRADLLFTDPYRLKRMARRSGPLQIIYGGKAHPHDEGGKALIRRVFQAADEVKDVVRVVYLEDYDMALGGLLVAGVDLWLNTPLAPHEASGTSGMKAALNGVPSLSVLDGWWVEGHVENVTGWSIEGSPDAAAEAESLYGKLERVILPLYYDQPDRWAETMRSTIAINGSFFNAQRMVSQYVHNAYQVVG